MRLFIFIGIFGIPGLGVWTPPIFRTSEELISDYQAEVFLNPRD